MKATFFVLGMLISTSALAGGSNWPPHFIFATSVYPPMPSVPIAQPAKTAPVHKK